METTEKCVKSVQSKQRHENNINVIVLVSIINIILINFTHCSGVSNVDFDQVRGGWENCSLFWVHIIGRQLLYNSDIVENLKH